MESRNVQQTRLYASEPFCGSLFAALGVYFLLDLFLYKIP